MQKLSLLLLFFISLSLAAQCADRTDGCGTCTADLDCVWCESQKACVEYGSTCSTPIYFEPDCACFNHTECKPCHENVNCFWCTQHSMCLHTINFCAPSTDRSCSTPLNKGILAAVIVGPIVLLVAILGGIMIIQKKRGLFKYSKVREDM
eukprot:TRINITY_DN2164_c0_g1_i4.p1 TRINITY_DN2164_c0_g1~~TRINITY_DN2164_c0_g1_i4.p1  ORF type:complete len:166 (+),score=16.09 TRINITY_DN2164_c0_g1_i4:51-500(+)